MWRLGRWLPEPARVSAIDDGAVRGRELSLGLSQGAPFLLDPTGGPDTDVLAFFSSATFGLLSEQTQLSYAKDLRLFLSFLSSQGRGWREATWSEVLDYEHWRRRDAANPRRVSGTKIMRELAAGRKFYEWQLRRGRVSTNPFAGEGTSGSGLRVKDVRSQRVKWLTPLAFQQWRDVGLGGRRLDGSGDSSSRVRSSSRNVAFANLLWSSGLRLREAGSLLMIEVPALDSSLRFHRARVGQAVAKGRGRDYWMGTNARRDIESYVVATRAAAIGRAQREGRYDDLPGLLILRKASGRQLVIEERDGGVLRETTLDLLTASERARLFQDAPAGLEPLMMFLGESGLPMRYSSWEAVFSAANARCGAAGLDVSCHPHMLRHSFALRMLVTLMHAFDRRMGLTPEERRDYRILFGDPWVLVQTLLGHTNPQTTRDVYLEPVRGLHVELFLNTGDEVNEDAGFTAAVRQHLAETGLVADGADVS